MASNPTDRAPPPTHGHPHPTPMSWTSGCGTGRVGVMRREQVAGRVVPRAARPRNSMPAKISRFGQDRTAAVAFAPLALLVPAGSIAFDRPSPPGRSLLPPAPCPALAATSPLHRRSALRGHRDSSRPSRCGSGEVAADQGKDGLAGFGGQLRPCRRDLRQPPRRGSACAGFCAALPANRTISRRIRGLFDSPWGY